MRQKVVKAEDGRHESALSLGATLSVRRANVISPIDVIVVLNEAKVGLVLMGAHAIGGWTGEPRATQDVDILVKQRHHKKGVSAIQRAFPHLLVREEDSVTRLVDPASGKEVIDIMRPLAAIHQAVFKNSVKGGSGCRIPSLEMAVGCKYAAMISPHRDAADKHQDAAVLVRMARDNQRLDESLLGRLGDLLHPLAGEDLIKFVNDARAGRKIEF